MSKGHSSARTQAKLSPRERDGDGKEVTGSWQQVQQRLWAHRVNDVRSGGNTWKLSFLR